MSNNRQNYFRACRLRAGLKQEAAALKLNISVRTLCAYETGERLPESEIVDAMVRVYSCPDLVWWYLHTHTPWGKYLPEIKEPASSCEMAFQALMMLEDLEDASEIIKQVMHDDCITQDESNQMRRFGRLIEMATDRGASIQVFAESL